MGAICLLITLAAGLSSAGVLGLRVNLTESIPTGLYLVVGGASAVRQGDVVLVCLPEPVARFAHSRGYVPDGGRCPGQTAPVGKVVIALPGDTISVSSAGLSVNGIGVQFSKPLPHDGKGRPLPRLRDGKYLVRTDSLWLAGTSPKSFDSRYIGPVAIENVIERVRRI